MFSSLKAFKHSLLLVQTYNTTVLSYLNQRGEAKSCSLNQLTREFTLWCLDRGITLLAVHLAGANNIDPDLLSRQLTNRQLRLENSVEWSLDQGVANLLFCVCGNPIVDLFTPGPMRKCLFFQPSPGSLGMPGRCLAGCLDKGSTLHVPTIAVATSGITQGQKIRS